MLTNLIFIKTLSCTFRMKSVVHHDILKSKDRKIEKVIWVYFY